MTADCICPWCEARNSGQSHAPIWCSRCLHRADLKKELCDCLMCEPFAVALPEIPEIVPPNESPSAPPFNFLRIEDPISELQSTDSASCGVEVVGRYFKAPYFSVTVYPSRVVLKIDDHKNPDQWLHIFLDAETVGRWVHAMGMADSDLDDGEGIE